ncbi:hypothetical protein DAEQUDRAFT_644010, partial [Daedalea quercina L-15889]
LALASTVASVAASPVHVSRAIWDPEILTPNAQTVWVQGQTYEVTWDTANPPANVSNPYGQVLLGKGGVEAVLASDFALTDGSVEVTVPTGLEPGSDYEVILFGDSGNISPEFTIQ